jgi:hypothetical protein
MHAQFVNTTLFQLAAALFCMIVLAYLSPVQAECPMPNSEFDHEEIRGKVRTVICRCKKGYHNYKQECRYISEVREELLAKGAAAARGARHSADAILAEAAALGLDRLKSRAGALVVAIGAAWAGQGKATIAFLLALEVDLAVFLSEVGNCSASEEVRINCANMGNFQRIIRENNVELKRLQESAERR